MLPLDAVLQGSAKLFRVLNQRLTVLAMLLVGAPVSVYLLKDAWQLLPFWEQVVAVYSLALLPLLLYKALLYFLLTVFDYIVMFFADYRKDYQLDLERVRARIASILYQRKVKYQSLDKLALGGERGILDWLRDKFRLTYPLIFVCTEKPFLVIKIFRYRPTVRLERIRSQLAGQSIYVHIFHGEDKEARVIAKLVANALEILSQEGMQAVDGKDWKGKAIDLKLQAPKEDGD